MHIANFRFQGHLSILSIVITGLLKHIVLSGPPTPGLALVLVPIDNRLRLDRACSRLLLQVLLPRSSHPAVPFPNQDACHPCLSPRRPPCHPPLPGGRHLPPA